MIVRTALQELEKWSKRPDRKPIVLRGARQTGKTWIAREFGKHFKHFLEINLEKEENRQLFEQQKNLDKLLQTLFLQARIPWEPEHTLLFLDEIQYSPTAIKQLRYLYEEHPSLKTIAAGSLLETLLEFKESFPVGRVEYLNIYPVSFEEYLMTIEAESLLQEYQKIPLNNFATSLLFEAFHTYTMIGGMPEILQTYIDRKDVLQLSAKYDGLISGYLQDVEKYGKNPTQKKVLRHIIHTGFAEVGSRIKFQNFGASSYRSREVSEAFRALEKAFLLHLIYPTVETQLPLKPDYKKAPKLFWCDTGLVNYYNHWQEELLHISDLNEKYRSKITEQITAQEITSKHQSILPPFSFWVRDKGSGDAEVDFVIAHKGKIIPIEVKSGKTGRLRSLHQFMERAPHQIAVRVYRGPLLLQKTRTITGHKPYYLLNLPYFLAGKLREYLDWMAAEIQGREGGGIL